MSNNNYIDPNKLFSLLKKFVDGGPYTSDPSEGDINLGGDSQSLFGNQLETANPFGATNPFAQPNNQITLGNTQGVGTPQDNRAITYDWQKNDQKLDPYLNFIENKEDWSKSEEDYWKSNRGNNKPDLNEVTQNYNRNQGGFADFNEGTSEGVDELSSNTPQTQAEYDKMQRDKLTAKDKMLDAEGNPWTEKSKEGALPEEEIDDAKVTDDAKGWANLMGSGLLNSPGHVSMEQGIYSGVKHLADGKTGIGAMNLGSALFKGAKSAVFGLADNKVNKETKEWYLKKKRDERNKYGSDSQWRDNNYTGGYYGKYGGTVNNGLSEFLAGGTNWTPPTEEEDAVANFISSRSPNVYEGPISEKDAELLDTRYPSTSNPDFSPMLPPDAKRMRGLNQFVEGEQISDEERESIERWRTENFLRSTYLPNYGEDGQQMSETYHPSKNKIKYMENRSPRLGAMEEGGTYDPVETGKGLFTEDNFVKTRRRADGRVVQKEISENRFNRIQDRYDRRNGDEENDDYTTIHRGGNKSVSGISTAPTRGLFSGGSGFIGFGGGSGGGVPSFMSDGGNFSESMDNYRRLFEGGGLMGNIAPGGMPQQSDKDGTENYQVGQHVEFEYGGKMVSGKIKKILNGQIFI